jgi:5-deoxy-D-glucuronate isomerase
MDDLRGAFRILQVVQASHSTEVSTTSISYVTTGLTASITPQATTSKILAFVSMPTEKTTVSIFSGAFIGLFRGTVAGTNLVENLLYSEQQIASTLALNWLDSPSTTSSQVYTVGIKTNSAAVTVKSCVINLKASLVLMEVSA